MPSRFAAVTNKEISQLINQAVPEIHKGDEVRFCRQEKSDDCIRLVIARQNCYHWQQ